MTEPSPSLPARRIDIGHGESPFVDLPVSLQLRSVVDDTTSTQALLGEWPPRNRAFPATNPSAPPSAAPSSCQPQHGPVYRPLSVQSRYGGHHAARLARRQGGATSADAGWPFGTSIGREKQFEIPPPKQQIVDGESEQQERRVGALAVQVGPMRCMIEKSELFDCRDMEAGRPNS